MGATEYMDDLSTRVKQFDSKVQEWAGKDVYAFLRTQFNNQGIKIVAQTANLTEEQIRQGMRGQAPAIAAPGPGSGNLQNGIPSQISKSMGGYGIYILLGLAGLLALSMLKKRRG